MATVTFEADGESDELDVPDALIEALSEPGDDAVDVVTDIALMSFTGRAHALIHHTEGEPSEALAAAESELMDRFEERFGMTYGEATGHSH